MRIPDLAIDVGGASCALWWSSTPTYNGKRVGFIGRYRREDEGSARALLMRAKSLLSEEGCQIAVGPVDGDTWHSYRFVTERGDQPPFFLEPDNPDCYPRDFVQAGFISIAHYVSAEEGDLSHGDPRSGRTAVRLAKRGVTIRCFDPARYDEELASIYDVACKSFQENLLFSPVSIQEFADLYEPLRHKIDSDFIRIAEHDGQAVAFAFGMLDPRDPLTLVGKTQARLPDLAYAGLGAVMLDDVRRAARERGIRRIVHALIRDDNVALNASRKVATTIRGYSLFGQELT